MDTEHLEKQLQTWNRLMYLALGSAITIVAASIGQFLGIVWLVIQILITSSGFFLLWGKRWRALPLSRDRVNTIFGYLLASWLALFVPMMLEASFEYGIVLLGYAIFLVVIYWRTQKKLSDSEDVFP